MASLELSPAGQPGYSPLRVGGATSDATDAHPGTHSREYSALMSIRHSPCCIKSLLHSTGGCSKRIREE